MLPAHETINLHWGQVEERMAPVPPRRILGPRANAATHTEVDQGCNGLHHEVGRRENLAQQQYVEPVRQVVDV
eukprot:9489619-Pyramimonas_sp.AAC.1